MRTETEGPGEPRVSGAAQPTPPGERPAGEVVAETAEPPVLVEETESAEWARSNLPLVGKLSSGAYYLQVGAFSSPRSAKGAIDVLDQDYPIAVVPVESAERTVYRLFVGPLNEDERGTMLYWFRARGYKDAFIRKGD
jgi:cell division protein FtsN